MELTHQFADFLVKTNYEDLPSGVVDLARERLLDTIGAMLAGRAGWNYADALIAAMEKIGKGECGIIGKNPCPCFPAPRAAMLNATFAHSIELDDGHKFAGVHAGAVVVPTALVMGAKLNATGKDILTAIVLGYEIVYRLAAAQSPQLIDRGFHPSATCDTIGAAAVAGKLMKLDEERMANGLGMAGLQASGLMEATVSGQQSKCVMVGNAAYNGICCAYVAEQGLPGTTTVFEGKTGLFQAMSRTISPELVTERIGKDYQISETYNKFYPTCRHSQPAIEAVLNLAVKNDIDPEGVAAVEVGTHRVAYELTGIIYEPKNPGEAKFSIPYGVALALKDHGVAVRHLKEEAYTDRGYLKLAKLVTVRIDEAVNSLYPKKRGAQVKIIMKDGTEYEEECYDLKGSPQNPVGFDELVEKFITAATGLLKEETIKEVIDRCTRFEQESDPGSFLSLLNW